MNETAPPRAREETPVDDIRRIRRRLSEEVKGDVRAQVELSRRAAEEYRAKLGLKAANPEGQSCPATSDPRNPAQ